MRNFRSATITEINEIHATLHRATERPNSRNFLEGFPWTSTEWFLAELEKGDFESFLLFWDNSAWKQSSSDRYRRLDTGLKDFIKDKEQDPNQWNGHLREILDKRTWPASGHIYLVLIGANTIGPFMIIDGNHRAVATLWNIWELGSHNSLPTHAWLGVSPEVSNYRSFG